MASQVFDSTTTSITAPGGVWTDARRAFAAWRQKRATRARIARELATYTDRELMDVGLFRSDVPAVVAGTFRR